MAPPTGVTGVNAYVMDILTEIEVDVAVRKGTVTLTLSGSSKQIAYGPDLPTAIVDGLHQGQEDMVANAPALLLVAALAYDPEELFGLMDALWGEDDEDEGDEPSVEIVHGSAS